MDAIIYTSNTGSTRRYAMMLGQLLKLPVYSADEGEKNVPKGADIIYLGWIMAGEVKGYKVSAKKYHISAVCAVGMGKSGTQTEQVRQKNSIPDETDVFTLQGGFDINKLHGAYKMMMAVMIKTAGKALREKNDRTDEEDNMLEMMQNGGDRVNSDNLKLILDRYENQNNKKA